MATNIEKTITLGDGTILEDSYCGYDPGSRYLWCYVSGKSMMDCMRLFSDSYKTSTIISYYFVKGYVYKGFTELLLVQKSNDTVDVRLTWPEGVEHSVEELEEPEDEQ